MDESSRLRQLTLFGVGQTSLIPRVREDHKKADTLTSPTENADLPEPRDPHRQTFRCSEIFHWDAPNAKNAPREASTHVFGVFRRSRRRQRRSLITPSRRGLHWREFRNDQSRYRAVLILRCLQAAVALGAGVARARFRLKVSAIPFGSVENGARGVHEMPVRLHRVLSFVNIYFVSVGVKKELERRRFVISVSDAHCTCA